MSDDGPVLGWNIMAGDDLLKLLHRVQAGEDADMVYAEMYANAEHIRDDEEDD